MLWRLHGTGRWWKYLSHLCFERLISFLHKVGEISNCKVEVKMCHSHPCFYYLDLWKHLDDFLDAIKRLLVTYETDNYSYFYEIFWFYQFFFSPYLIYHFYCTPHSSKISILPKAICKGNSSHLFGLLRAFRCGKLALLHSHGICVLRSRKSLFILGDHCLLKITCHTCDTGRLFSSNLLYIWLYSYYLTMISDKYLKSLIFPSQGIVGSSVSGKSDLLHRYLTGEYAKVDSFTGRHKKEVCYEGQSHLLLIRNETGPPDVQVLCQRWAVCYWMLLESASGKVKRMLLATSSMVIKGILFYIHLHGCMRRET